MAASAEPITSANMTKAKSLVFGGHIGPQSKRTLQKHAQQILNGPNGGWMLETLADMPRYWETILEKIPEIAGTMQGANILADLELWLREVAAANELKPTDTEVPDIWLGFMMIAIQLDQYWRYLEFRSHSLVGDVQDPQAQLAKQQQTQSSTGGDQVETVGFCAGLIAAVAVASSHNRQDFEKYGAVALRIGVIMAILVGACETWSKGLGKGCSISLATAWRTPKQGQDMTRIVSSLSPDAYVSVLFDESRATITASERLAPKLIRQLRAAGVTAIPLAAKGRLHAPDDERKHHTDALIEICHAIPELQFPDAVDLALPTYLDHPEGKQVSSSDVDLTGSVLHTILTDRLSWSTTVAKLVTNGEEVSLIAFGLDRPIPPTVVSRFGSRQVHFEDIEAQLNKFLEPSCKPSESKNTCRPSNNEIERQTEEPNEHNAESEKEPQDVNDENLIAVVGMSVKTAGANDLESFGEMLKSGASQHQLITRERMVHDIMFRGAADADTERKWYGNFADDTDAFDHKFFKRSPREAMAIDPQGRLSLQGAYQAVEQSGYFNELAMTSSSAQKEKKHVGVYVGLCSFEYELNVASHQPSAFTATGALRSFIPGRLSHYFGWTGPSMTIDTACSSSTVAIHTACRDLLSGEVPAALCGGVNVLTNLSWTQNLAAGSFISPSGQCKPFDVDADGYCRGDGIGYIFLKKLSKAKAEGNMILGTIRATGMNQNLNSTPLFVPNVVSLSTLFSEVIQKARVEPRDISLVECHGTGTPVGDPAEYESIRRAVAGPLRNTVVPIGSVKGSVGHTEGASGIISLIKVLVMMREGFIPPQAGFNKMNPYIHAQQSDMMEVVTSLRPWREDHKVALINNYGACGNNMSSVVEHTAHKPARHTLEAGSPASRLPFWIPGIDSHSIAAYSKKLASYLQRHTVSDGQVTLADVALNMKRQSNPSLPQGLIFSCASLTELQDMLTRAASATPETGATIGIIPVRPERSVILCFGGQVSTFVGLDRALYNGVDVLRYHLDQCNAVVMSQGLESIYPDIFSCEPIQDVVKLQTALFAMQYASAKSWLDCGLLDKVVSVVGHSFGEITALCIAGVLSLEDTVKLIAGRAQLVRDAWGPDPGAMIAVEADEAPVQDVLKQSNLECKGSASIACYNGRRSFTVAGPKKDIDAFAQKLSDESKMMNGGVKSKLLNVTNAFHSTLVEALIDGLGELGKELNFKKAAIPIERASDREYPSDELDWTFVPSHMRQPVYFDHAVQRLIQKHPQAIFLEAGSNSTITVMAARAHAQADLKTSDGLHFQSVSITNTKKGFDGLTDATVALWKQGLRVSFWAHHRLQLDKYAQLLLPPYQFQNTKHWLEHRSPRDEIIKEARRLIASGDKQLMTAGGIIQPEQQEQIDPRILPMWTFIGYQDSQRARFRINTASDKYQRLFTSHVIAQTAPMCPATLELDMAIETAFSLRPDCRAGGYSAILRDMVSHTPVCADSTRVRFIDLEPLHGSEAEWHFSILSESVGSSIAAIETHAEGRIQLVSPSEPSFLQEFGRYERAVSHEQCRAVLQLGPNDEGVEALQGRHVYRAFEDVVDFGSVYHGVKSIVGRSNHGDGNGREQSAGVVHKRHGGDTWLDVPKADSFGQVAGMYVNLLTDLPANEMYIATGLELTMRSPRFRAETGGHENGPGVWHVLANHAREQSDRSYVTDVYVFDAATRALEDIIMGLRYVRVAKATMNKILARMTVDKQFVRSKASAPVTPSSAPVAKTSLPISAAAKSLHQPVKTRESSISKSKDTSKRDLATEVRAVVSNVSGIEPNEMTLETEMADLGIDSLMGMELAREIENTFKCTLDQAKQLEATNLGQFIALVANTLATAGTDHGNGQEEEGDDDVSDNQSATTGDGSSTAQTDDTEVDSSSSDGGLELPVTKRFVPSSSVPALTSTIDASTKVLDRGDLAARTAEAEGLVTKYTDGWESALLKAGAEQGTGKAKRGGAVVVVTGATGSLGSHLVHALAERSDVAIVACVNRSVSQIPAKERQLDALTSRGMELSAPARSKLQVYDTDTSKPQLGLQADEYAWLAREGTHIIHNAWPMSGTRTLKAYETQIRVMRNLLDLARDMATITTTDDLSVHICKRVGFQFVSSIGVVGFSSDGRQSHRVLEQAVPMAAVMPGGYNEGKWVCERMLAETLGRYPRLFRASAVRSGQISGSTLSGVWNPVEHFPFLVKSARALKLWPDLQGELHWLPVNKSAGSMVDLLKIDEMAEEEGGYRVYHIDNPIGQSWKSMSAVLASTLDIPPNRIIPFRDWAERVRQSPLSGAENPAAGALDFLESHFERMACGGIVLDTRQSSEDSETLAVQGPITEDLVRAYVSAWKASGFLN
ncbi:putative polyketide synthase [Xylariaceae sp. FL0255]|nr:putative polyketide synthase [Xylariaceae sp. FL0255]